MLGGGSDPPSTKSVMLGGGVWGVPIPGPTPRCDVCPPHRSYTCPIFHADVHPHACHVTLFRLSRVFNNKLRPSTNGRHFRRFRLPMRLPLYLFLFLFGICQFGFALLIYGRPGYERITNGHMYRRAHVHVSSLYTAPPIQRRCCV